MILNDNYLILLCKFKNDYQINQLNLFLKSNISDHFIPNIILPLENNIPLNINGKIDRSKLHSLYLNTVKNSPDNNLSIMWQVGEVFELFSL